MQANRISGRQRPSEEESPSETPLREAATSPAAAYLAVRAATVELCAPLAVEDHVVQSMPDASPAKWHLAHTSWFFEEFVLARAAADYSPYLEAFRYLFNFYCNSAGPMHRRAARDIVAVWAPAQSRIEMRLVSARRQSVHLAGESVEFAAGERLVTEHRHKYSAESFASQARTAGWTPRRSWSDARGCFSVQYLETV